MNGTTKMTGELTILCAKWRNPNPNMAQCFTAEHVNTFCRMLSRHLKTPHRVICITDDPSGLDCDHFPIWNDYADLKSHPLKDTQVNCYRKMRVLDKTFASEWGPRALWMDLDVVVLDDFSDLLRIDAPFVGWRPTMPKCVFERPQYSGSMFLFTPGHPEVAKIWDSFSLTVSPRLAWDAGYRGSDQGWISYVLEDNYPGWTQDDGVVWYTTDAYRSLPDHAKIVFFVGDCGPWHYRMQSIPWVRENWR